MNLKMLAQESHELKSICDFKNFIKTRIRSVFKHEMAICGIGDLNTRRVIRLINVDFPSNYLCYSVQPNQVINSDLVNKWIENQQPIVFDVEQVNADFSTEWLDVVRNNKIQTIASHGIVDPCNQNFSYFGFGNADVSINNDIHTKLIEMIPFLHYALARVLVLKYSTTNLKKYSENAISFRNETSIEIKKNSSLITDREKEIVSWIALGKGNKEIAQILEISPSTVNNHIKSLFKRLDVTSRAQAVSKAVSLSII